MLTFVVCPSFRVNSNCKPLDACHRATAFASVLLHLGSFAPRNATGETDTNHAKEELIFSL